MAENAHSCQSRPNQHSHHRRINPDQPLSSLIAATIAEPNSHRPGYPNYAQCSLPRELILVPLSSLVLLTLSSQAFLPLSRATNTRTSAGNSASQTYPVLYHLPQGLTVAQSLQPTVSSSEAIISPHLSVHSSSASHNLRCHRSTARSHSVPAQEHGTNRGH